MKHDDKRVADAVSSVPMPQTGTDLDFLFDAWTTGDPEWESASSLVEVFEDDFR